MFGSFIRKNSFLNRAPFVDLTPASRKMYYIVYALFVFSFFQNVLCENTNDSFKVSYENSHLNDLVRNKRNDQKRPSYTFKGSEYEPVADKLIAQPTGSNNNHPMGNHEVEQEEGQAPKWTKPELMERQVYAKPLNEIVSLIMF